MNKQWIDEKLNVLLHDIGNFKTNHQEFYFEPTELIYEKLESGNEHDLLFVTTKIAKHLEIVYFPTVKYDWGIKLEPEVAGQIRVANSIEYIQIPFFYVGKKYGVGAILAHEMTHAFLFSKGIFFNDTSENEMFTDLSGIFLGLGKLILNGYIGSSDEYVSQGYALGYLSHDLIAYAYKKINAFQSISPELAMKNLRLDVINKIDNLLMPG